jgi:hypothetical protein
MVERNMPLLESREFSGDPPLSAAFESTFRVVYPTHRNRLGDHLGCSLIME